MRGRMWLVMLVMGISLSVSRVAEAASPFSWRTEFLEVKKETAFVCFKNFWATEKLNDYTETQGVSFSPFLLEGKIGLIPKPPVGILYGFGNEKVRRNGKEGVFDVSYFGAFWEYPIEKVSLGIDLGSMKVDSQLKNLNFSVDVGSLNAYLDIGKNRFVLNSLMIRPGLALDINVGSGLNLEMGIDYTYLPWDNWRTVRNNDLLPEPEFDISGWSGKIGIRIPW